jgi:glycosyltransferase involved in cell wall biosynthesis
MVTFNGGKYIRRQIDSILSQINEGDELLISDDGSKDATLDIISGYNDKRIKILRHAKNDNLLSRKYNIYRIVAENYENVLKHVQGDYVFLSDQDDIWEPHRVAVMIDGLQHFDLLMCNINLMDENDVIIRYNYLQKNPIKKSLFLNIICLPFRACCMAFDRKLLKYILPFPVDVITCDSWIGCIAHRYGKVGYIPEALHNYRIHSENVSRPFRKSRNSLLFKIQYRIDLLKNIFKLGNIISE